MCTNSNFTGGGILISITGADGVEISCQTVVEFNLNCEESPSSAKCFY